MAASQTKIITKLRERRQIESDLQQMRSAGSQAALQQQAERIAGLGSQVIPAIVGNLDLADAPLVAAMGTVAAHVDRDEVAEALRLAVHQPHRTDRGRLAAITILDRYLGMPPDDSLLENLVDPQAAAVRSLRDVLEEAKETPAVLVEYLQGLDRQEPDTGLAVVWSLREAADLLSVEPLRLMAQDVRDEIAAEALQALGDIRLVESAQSLQTLFPVVSPSLRPLAERALRKLQFGGIEVQELGQPDPEWRALVSPVDSMGQQSVWFVQAEGDAGQARFLNVLLSDRAGAVEAAGYRQVSLQALPPRRQAGHVHDVVLPGGPGVLLMLEISFERGRYLVAEALARNRETQIPIAGVLRMLSTWLWDTVAAQAPEGRVLPELSVEDGVGIAGSDRLLSHPAFATWSLQSEGTLQAAHDALRHPGFGVDAWVRRLTAELLEERAVLEVLSRRLVTMSEWLLLAGEEEFSRLALVSASALLGKELHEHPFVSALVRRDLELAEQSL
ncbi:hypothetical protein ACFLUM_02000, partial [Chloroflexota bacterium]